MKEQILALAVQSGFKLDWAISNCTGQFESFYHEAIEYYKAELLKEVGEPTCWMTPDGEGWRMRTKPPETDTKLGWMEFYTSNQLAIAILKATKPLEDEVVKWREASRVKHLEAIDWAGKHQAISYQLAAAQEEINDWRNQAHQSQSNFERAQDQLTKAEQLWQVAQGRCDGLEEKLAKAEQRVAEACADLLVDRFKHEVAGTLAIRQGEWRKFVNEV